MTPRIRGPGPSRCLPGLAGIRGARPRGAGTRRFSAAAPTSLRGPERSPPPAPRSGTRARPERESRDRRGTSPPEHRGPLPAPSAPLATHPLLADSARGRPGKGRGREGGARTSERPARPAEPQAGGEQDEAAGPEPPHPAAAASRPARTPGGRRATCTGPTPPVVWTLSLARGAAPNRFGGWTGAGRAISSLQLLRPISARPHSDPRRRPGLFPALTLKSIRAAAGGPAPRQSPEGMEYVAPVLPGEICDGVKCTNKWRLEKLVGGRIHGEGNILTGL